MAEPSARERKKADRRRAILEAALALIEERGLKGATFELIAQRAGVARGTVFNYFPNKEAILVAYFATQLGELARRVAERRERHALPGEPRSTVWRRSATSSRSWPASSKGTEN